MSAVVAEDHGGVIKIDAPNTADRIFSSRKLIIFICDDVRDKIHQSPSDARTPPA